MIQDRAIIHLNIADFAAGVETCLRPGLQGHPFIIAPMGAPRARVFDMNELAFKEGIRKGMLLSRARKTAPGIQVLPPRFNQYERAMKAVIKQATAISPQMESGQRDGHLFLDITGTSRLYGPPPDVAFRLRKAIRKDQGLDPIWTLATNRLVAKVASRVVKPLGEYIVGPGEEASFLAPLPISILPGLTREEQELMSRFNLVSIDQARGLTPAQLAVPFNKRALHIHHLLQGIDPSPGIRSGSENSNPRAEHEFPNDTNDKGEIKAVLAVLAAELSRPLVQNREIAGEIGITLSYSDGIQHRNTMTSAAVDEIQLLAQAWDLLLATWTRRVRIRHMALSCDPKPRPLEQSCLFTENRTERPAPTGMETRRKNSGKIALAMESIRERFGTLAVQTGTALGGFAPGHSRA